MSNSGIVYLVGGGPGAVDLITVKGLRCLQRADVVLYDDLSSRALLQEAPAAAEQVYVGKRRGHKAMGQDQVCELLVEHARQGRRVVRLKGGDPFVLGRGGEEAEALARAGIPFEVIPGVSAAVAVPAYAGIPLTHRDLADGFEVYTGHGNVDPTAGRRTVVVLMGVRRLAENVEQLLRQGYPEDLPAAVIQWGTVPRQRTVVSTLQRIAEEASDAESPAILVVGKVVELRERLSWFEHRPLFGLRVLVTRTRHQAPETCRLLEELGAATVEMPTIVIKPVNPEPLRRAIRRVQDYDYLILTSANALEPLRQTLVDEGLDSRALAGLTICAIGPGTALALSEIGIQADLVPEDHRAEGVLDLLDAERVRGKRVLLPRAARAREILPETLRERGAEVDLIQVYETGLPEPEAYRAGLDRLERGEVDVLSFTSASTVDNFAAIVGPGLHDLCAGKMVLAIGPITKEACERVGLHVDVMPETYTLPAMVEALAEHHARNQSCS